MIELIGRIRERLANVAYVNEAAISHGIVTPILNGLGWDSSDPNQLVPEYTVQRCRVDFALLGLGRKPAVFIEVKGVGLAVHADKQLFEYAFHEGVPLCVLTDGREWNFYLPGAQGSYDDRRVYRLQLDERAPHECMDVLSRYLGRHRVVGTRPSARGCAARLPCRCKQAGSNCVVAQSLAELVKRARWHLDLPACG